MCARYLGAQVYWLLGYPENGLALGSEGLALAERSAHPFSFACALQSNSMLHLDRGEPELALQRLEAAEALAAEQRLGFVLEPQLLRGAALTAHGAFEQAVACLREGLEGRNGATRLRCYGLAKLADALTRQGEYSSALAAARDGLTLWRRRATASGRPNFTASKASRCSVSTGLRKAKTPSNEAFRVAQRQQAKAYELRAATSLARLWGEQDRRAAGARTPGPGLWLVHRGLRYRRI